MPMLCPRQQRTFVACKRREAENNKNICLVAADDSFGGRFTNVTLQMSSQECFSIVFAHFVSGARVKRGREST